MNEPHRNAEYRCPDCGVTMTDQGLFGKPSYRRFRCDNAKCEWKGTSYPEASLIHRLQHDQRGNR